MLRSKDRQLQLCSLYHAIFEVNVFTSGCAVVPAAFTLLKSAERSRQCTSQQCLDALALPTGWAIHWEGPVSQSCVSPTQYAVGCNWTQHHVMHQVQACNSKRHCHIKQAYTNKNTTLHYCTICPQDMHSCVVPTHVCASGNPSDNKTCQSKTPRACKRIAARGDVRQQTM